MLARKVKKLEREVETKVLTTNQVGPITNSEDTRTGVLWQWTMPSQGAGENQRLNSSLMIQSLHLKFLLKNGNVTDNTPCLARIMVVYDRRNAGTTPTIANILEYDDYNSPYNMKDKEFKGRFKILMDQKYTIRTDCPVMTKEWYYNKPLEVVFNAGTTGTAAEIERGAIFVIQFGYIWEATASSDTTGYYRYRCRFKS
jgi:hypothetical protein